MPQILFVCASNRSSSKMAEAYMKARLNELGVEGYTIISAGTAAKRGTLMCQQAIDLLNEMHCPPETIGVTTLTLKEIKGSDLIVCMTEEILKKLLKSYRSAEGKTIHLMSRANAQRDVFEPRSTLESHRQCFGMMKPALDNMIQKFI